MTSRRFKVLAPLQDFQWGGRDFELAPGIWIRRYENPPDIARLEEHLSKDEWGRVRGASHWVAHEWTEDDVPAAGEVENLILLSLWLVKSTRAQIQFRFKVGIGSADGNTASRLLDRFMWVQGFVQPDFEDVDLQSASRFLPVLLNICSARARLNDALLLTLSGCWSHAWQVALICHAAAAEALLTYSTGPGITRRLATSYACVTETQRIARDAAFAEFSQLYAIRGDIMHGRTYNIAVADRLPTLVRFQAALRKLWTVVCSTSSLIAVLEGSDAKRAAHLQGLQASYTPPP